MRFNSASQSLQVCHNRQWEPYSVTKPNPLPSRSGLIGHWKMDEETGTYVDDDSGHENHGVASGGPAPARGKFSRGRYFSGDGLITIQNSPKINFDKSSFSVSGWEKILDVKYPLTTFAVKKGSGCYYKLNQPKWNPGWEIGHAYNANGIDVCIRDKGNNKARGVIVHDNGYQPSQMIGKWTHYTFVFDRKAGKVRVYVNGKKQKNELDISSVTGSVDNNFNLYFGEVNGWKTKGTLDEYRLYNYALKDEDVKMIYLDHRV